MLGVTTAMPRRLNTTGRYAICSSGPKFFALFFLVFLLPGLARCQDRLGIDSIGLRGYYSNAVPVPVQIHLPASSQPESLRLELTVRSGYVFGQGGVIRTDRFFKRVSLPAGQANEVQVPVLIPQTPWGALDVKATTADGRVIGSASQDFKTLESLTQNQYLVAVYCDDQNAKCQSAQSQIAFHDKGTQSTLLRLIQLRGPRPQWWCYSPARAVVLAAPMSGFTQTQRAALEDYARAGGILVLLEDDIADKDFLAPYRVGAPTPAAIPIGRGHLYRLRSVASNDLAQQSFDSTFSKYANFVGYLSGQPSAEPLLSRVGVSFTFPRLRWLIVWLAAYLLIVGPLNFFLLHRAKRLEWGWLSTCLLALLFAASLYFSSSAHRPKNYTLDNVAVYWMDARSPVAVQDLGLRISSPERGEVAVSVNDDVVAVLAANLGYASSDSSSDVELGAEITDKQRIQEGWNVDVGPPVTATAAMLRWSTDDFNFEGFREFAGTVHWGAAKKLRNDTGISFREAVYLDYPENRRYFIPHLAAGDEIDLTTLNSTEIWKEEQSSGTIVRIENRGIYSPVKKGSFEIVDFPYSGFQIEPRSHIFAGLSDGPVPEAQLRTAAGARAKAALTIVVLGEK